MIQVRPRFLMLRGLLALAAVSALAMPATAANFDGTYQVQPQRLGVALRVSLASNVGLRTVEINRQATLVGGKLPRTFFNADRTRFRSQVGSLSFFPRQVRDEALRSGDRVFNDAEMKINDFLTELADQIAVQAKGPFTADLTFKDLSRGTTTRVQAPFNSSRGEFSLLNLPLAGTAFGRGWLTLNGGTWQMQGFLSRRYLDWKLTSRLSSLVDRVGLFTVDVNLTNRATLTYQR